MSYHLLVVTIESLILYFATCHCNTTEGLLLCLSYEYRLKIMCTIQEGRLITHELGYRTHDVQITEGLGSWVITDRTCIRMIMGTYDV